MGRTRSPGAILREVKKLAIEYKASTGKPLGVTGEIAEYEASRIFGLDLSVARRAGFGVTPRFRSK